MAKVTTKSLAIYAADQIQSGVSSKTIASQVASLLISERRSRDVQEFGRLLETELNARGTTQVVITSATEVDKVTKERLASVLGVKKALFYEVIDKSVIGGVRASTLNAQIDLTISGQLKAFKQAVNKESN